VDYLTLLLVNMAAGLLVLAWFFMRGFGGPNEKSWSPAFAMTGLVALVGGFYMVLTWPITQYFDGSVEHNVRWANAAFGETSVLLGILFLGAALSVSRNWSLVPVTIYGTIAGAIGVYLGVCLFLLGLSAEPILTAAGFVLTGLAGPLSLVIVLAPARKSLRWLTAACLVVACAIWLLTACLGYWGHLAMLSR